MSSTRGEIRVLIGDYRELRVSVIDAAPGPVLRIRELYRRRLGETLQPAFGALDNIPARVGPDLISALNTALREARVTSEGRRAEG